MYACTCMHEAAVPPRPQPLSACDEELPFDVTVSVSVGRAPLTGCVGVLDKNSAVTRPDLVLLMQREDGCFGLRGIAVLNDGARLTASGAAGHDVDLVDFAVVAEDVADGCLVNVCGQVPHEEPDARGRGAPAAALAAAALAVAALV